MRISDWSSDVCSSDLPAMRHRREWCDRRGAGGRPGSDAEAAAPQRSLDRAGAGEPDLRDPDLRSRPGQGAGQAGRAAATVLSATSTGSAATAEARRSEEHTSELQSLMRISYAVFCLKKKQTHEN